MERRLIVMRHAKSASATASTSDHERRLTETGIRQAEEIATRLIELGWTPQIVVGSDATRTRQTWETMEPHFEPAPPAQWSNSLYLAGVDAVEENLVDLSDDITDVLLLGHNPGWQNVISHFSGRHERLTPANAALLHSTGDTWADATFNGNFELVQVLRPA